MISDQTDYDGPNQSPVPMPRIDTSSDMYQNRDRSLTTYKKDLDHAVAYKDLPPPDEKQRVRAVPKRDPLQTEAFKSDLSKSEFSMEEQHRLTERHRAEALYPPLYDPRKAPPDRPVDASSFVTGGTVDVRA